MIPRNRGWMRAAGLGVLAGVGLAGCADLGRLSASDTPQVTIAIEVMPSILPGSAPGDLRITMTNTGRRPVEFFDSMVLQDFKVVVRNSDGAIVPYTEAGKNEANPSVIFRNILRHLQPGQQWSTDTALRTYFEMAAPGEYSVTVERSFSYSEGGPKAHVVSHAYDVLVEF